MSLMKVLTSCDRMRENEVKMTWLFYNCVSTHFIQISLFQIAMGVFSVHQILNFSLCLIKALTQQIPSASFCFQLHYAQSGLDVLDSPV